MIITIITDVEGETVEFVRDYGSEEAGNRSGTKGILTEPDRYRADAEPAEYLLLGSEAVPFRPLPENLVQAYRREWAAELVVAAVRLEEAIPALWLEMAEERADLYKKWGKVWLGTGLYLIQTFSGQERNTKLLETTLTPELIDLYMADLAEATANPRRYFWALSAVDWAKTLGDGENNEPAAPCLEQRYHPEDANLPEDEDGEIPDGFNAYDLRGTPIPGNCWKFSSREEIPLEWPFPSKEGEGLSPGSLSR